jgi:hypothetical protein
MSAPHNTYEALRRRAHSRGGAGPGDAGSA